eukprot:SM000054S18094  [mRNA]  locus=s54:393511:404012:+ [translate_table: standard]
MEVLVLDDISLGAVCTGFACLLLLLTALSTSILLAIDWRLWRIYSWIYAREWPQVLRGRQLALIAGLVTCLSWLLVLSPVALLQLWGLELIRRLPRHAVGLAVLLVGPAVLLAYSGLMLARRQRQSSRAVVVQLLAAGMLLCSYQVAAIYEASKSSASYHLSVGGFFFGLSVTAMSVNMCFICQMAYSGPGLDIDEYVRQAYSLARTEMVEMGHFDHIQKPLEHSQTRSKARRMSASISYILSVLVLTAYSIAYGITAKQAPWLGALTACAVLVLDWQMVACVLGFNILQSRGYALVIAGAYRFFLIAFGTELWYLGHCLAYAAVAGVLLFAAFARTYPVVSRLDARRAALADTIKQLRLVYSRRSVSNGRGLQNLSEKGIGERHYSDLIDLDSRCSEADSLASSGLHPSSGESEKSAGDAVDASRKSLETACSGVDINIKFMLEQKGWDASRIEAAIHGNHGRMGAQIEEDVAGKPALCLHCAVQSFLGFPERMYSVLTLAFVVETVLTQFLVNQHIFLGNASRPLYIYGCTALLLALTICSAAVYIRFLWAEEGVNLSGRSIRAGAICWLLSTCTGLLVTFLSKSSIVLALAVTLPIILAALSLGMPLWVHNGYGFFHSAAIDPFIPLHSYTSIQGTSRSRRDMAMLLIIVICSGSVAALGFLIDLAPLGDLPYHAMSSSPYSSPSYIGWTIATFTALLITSTLPAIAWFSTYRISPSSIASILTFIVVLFAYCGSTLKHGVDVRHDGIPTRADYLATFLPLFCAPALVLLIVGLYKWRDANWKWERGTCLLVGGSLLLLLGATTCVLVAVHPHARGARGGRIHFISATESVLLVLLAFLLTTAAVFIGVFTGHWFAGASASFFTMLILVATPSLQVILASSVIVYPPTLLPAFVYNQTADAATNCSWPLVVLFCAAVALVVWGVAASLLILPVYVGVAVTAIVPVAVFGFALSRPYHSTSMVDAAISCLNKDVIVQAMSRAAGKARRVVGGTHVVPRQGKGMRATVVLAKEDATAARDRSGRIVLPRHDLLKLRQDLVLATALLRDNADSYKHKVLQHARILMLEEAISTEWISMWSNFGGHFLLLLIFAARAEKLQDEAKLRKFLHKIGFSDLDASKIRNWTPEEQENFEDVRQRYMEQEEAAEAAIARKREEEARGRARRHVLLQKETGRRMKSLAKTQHTVFEGTPRQDDAIEKESEETTPQGVTSKEADVLPLTSPNTTKPAMAVNTQRTLTRTMSSSLRRCSTVKGEGPICSSEQVELADVLEVDETLYGAVAFTFSAAVKLPAGRLQAVCLLSIEASDEQRCLEAFISRAGQISLRIVRKGGRRGKERLMQEMLIGTKFLANNRWHRVAISLDSNSSIAAAYVDGQPDGRCECAQVLNYQNASLLERDSALRLGSWALMDWEARSQAEEMEMQAQISGVQLWGRALVETEVLAAHTALLCHLGTEKGEEDVESTDLLSVIESTVSPNPKKQKTEDATVVIDTLSMKLDASKETEQDIAEKMRLLEAAVRQTLRSGGELHFTDADFPPSPSSLHLNPSHPLPKLRGVSQWMRPSQFLLQSGSSAQPSLFSSTLNASDVCQGRLGDCWFLSAVAVLTEASRISNVIITPEYNEEGIYTVRFCIQGEWVPVVVDDWIPCCGQGRPAFATSRAGGGVLWVMLLEKAYAKLHGSYEALEGGVVQDALVDLTGGAGEEIDLTGADSLLDLASGRLWEQLLRFKGHGFLLGAGSPSGSDAEVSAKGIVQGHAYSLLSVVEVDGHRLLQIRNPWGDEVEWNGAWCDSSPLWTERLKHKLGYKPQAADGIFWMAWDDFQLHFRSLYVCRLYPPNMRTVQRSRWSGTSAGGCSNFDNWHHNPQFLLKAIPGPNSRLPLHVFITLTQGSNNGAERGRKSVGDSSHFYIGIRVVRRNGRKCGPVLYAHEAIGGSDYVNTREVACELILEPDIKGYTIVPTTYAPGEEALFLLSVFTSTPVTLEPLY